MNSRITKRNVFFLCVFIICIIIIIINYALNSKISNKKNVQSEILEESYLDNGLEFFDFLEKNEFLKDVIISNVIVTNNSIEYTIKNNTEKSIYISNQISLKYEEDNYNTNDTIIGKIEIQPFEEKNIKIEKNINEIGKTLGYKIDNQKLQILKPIYIEYNSNKLLGVAKVNE